MPGQRWPREFGQLNMYNAQDVNRLGFLDRVQC
jgi:hypothetical protein